MKKKAVTNKKGLNTSWIDKEVLYHKLAKKYGITEEDIQRVTWVLSDMKEDDSKPHQEAKELAQLEENIEWWLDKNPDVVREQQTNNIHPRTERRKTQEEKDLDDRQKVMQDFTLTQEQMDRIVDEIKNPPMVFISPKRNIIIPSNRFSWGRYSKLESHEDELIRCIEDSHDNDIRDCRKTREQFLFDYINSKYNENPKLIDGIIWEICPRVGAISISQLMVVYDEIEKRGESHRAEGPVGTIMKEDEQSLSVPTNDSVATENERIENRFLLLLDKFRLETKTINMKTTAPDLEEVCCQILDVEITQDEVWLWFKDLDTANRVKRRRILLREVETIETYDLFDKRITLIREDLKTKEIPQKYGNFLYRLYDDEYYYPNAFSWGDVLNGEDFYLYQKLAEKHKTTVEYLKLIEEDLIADGLKSRDLRFCLDITARIKKLDEWITKKGLGDKK